MKTCTLILSVFSTLSLIAVTIAGIMIAYSEPDPDSTTKLGIYFKERKENFIASIKDTEFLNISNYVKNKYNPIPEINKAFNESHYIYIPKNMHSLFSDQLSIPSNSIIKFEEGSSLLGRHPSGTNATQDCLFSIDGANNVTFMGNGLRIYMSKGNDSTDFPVLCIRGSKDILIMDFSVFGSDSAGLLISGGYGRLYSENIEIKNVDIQNSKTGILIQSVYNLRAYKLSVKFSFGKNDGGAIKISTNNSADILEDIIIENLVTERSKDSGLEISAKVDQLVITIRDYESRRDGGKAPIYFINSPNNGKVLLENIAVNNDEVISAMFKGWDTNDCVIEIIDPKLNWKPGFLYGVEEEDILYTNLERLKIQR